MVAANTVCSLPSASATGLAVRPRFRLPTVRILLAGFVDLLIVWQERAIQRRHLAGLDERGLKDVALSRADIAPEIAKPFWRA